MDPSCLIIGTKSMKFVINSGPDCFKQNYNYTINVDLFYPGTGIILNSDSLSVFVVAPPYKGKVAVSPQTGVALGTTFTMTASNWVSTYSRAQLQYQFFYVNSENNQTYALSQKSPIPSCQFTLPSVPINELMLVIQDQFFSYTTVFSKINLKPFVPSKNFTFKTFDPKGNNSANISLQDALTYSQSSQILANVSATKNAIVQTQINNYMAAQTNQLDQVNSSDQIQFLIDSSSSVFASMSDPINNLLDSDAVDVISSAFLNIFTSPRGGVKYGGAFSVSATGAVYADDDVETSKDQSVIGFQFSEDMSGNTLDSQHNNLKFILAAQAKLSEGNEEISPSAVINLQQKVRRILALFEVSQRNVVDDEFSTDIEYDTYRVIAQSMKPFYKDGQEDLAYTQMLPSPDQSGNLTSLNIMFPASKLARPVLNSMFYAVIYKMNIFYSTTVKESSVVSVASNHSVYITATDIEGTVWDGSQLNSPIVITLPFNFEAYNVSKNNTLCGYLPDGDSAVWASEKCKTLFIPSSNSIQCSCTHMSTYAIIYNNTALAEILSRQSTIERFIRSIKNYSAAPVYIYLLIFLGVGIFVARAYDKQDLQLFREQQPHKEDSINFEDSLALTALAMKRKVFFLPLANFFKFRTFLKVVILQQHPLFQIRYKIDPSLNRTNRFLFLFTRVMVLMIICFQFRNVNNLDQITWKEGKNVLICLFLAPLLLIPIPVRLFKCFTGRYYICNMNKINNDLDKAQIFSDLTQEIREEAEDKTVEEEELSENQKFYLDLNLPVRLLFLIIAMDLKQLRQSKIPFAVGDSNQVGKILSEIDDNPNDLFHSDKKKALKQTLTAESKAFKSLMITSNRQMRIEQIKNKKQPKARREEVKVQDIELNFELVPTLQVKDIQITPIEYNPDVSHEKQIDKESDDPFEGGEPESDMRDSASGPKSTQRSNSNCSRELIDSGKIDLVQPDGDDPIKSVNTSQVSEGDLNQNQVIDVIRPTYTFKLGLNQNYLGRLAYLGLLVAINLYLIGNMGVAIKREKYFTKEMKYTWMVLFFATQFIGFVVYDMLILVGVTAVVYKFGSSKKSLLFYYMKECQVFIYFNPVQTLFEDYVFTYKWIHTRIL